MRLQYNTKKETTNIIEMSTEEYSLIRYALMFTADNAKLYEHSEAAREMYEEMSGRLHNEAELIN